MKRHNKKHIQNEKCNEYNKVKKQFCNEIKVLEN